MVLASAPLSGPLDVGTTNDTGRTVSATSSDGNDTDFAARRHTRRTDTATNTGANRVDTATNNDTSRTETATSSDTSRTETATSSDTSRTETATNSDTSRTDTATSAGANRVDTVTNNDVIRTDTVSSDASHSSPRFIIEWEGAESCRPTRDVLDGLHRLLGTDPEQLLEEPLLVAAKIRRQSRGWSLVLSIAGRRGPIERQIDAASCAEIAQAASLIISLWIQPSRPQEPTSEHDTVAATIGSKTPSAAPLKHEPVESAGGRRRPPPELVARVQLGYGAMQVRTISRLQLRAFVGLTFLHGALPSTAVGVTAGVAGDLNRWELGLAASWLDSQSLTRLEPIAVSGNFGLWSVTARIARTYRLYDGLRLQPGVWALAGRLHAEASGRSMQSSTPSDGDWGATGAEVSVMWSLGRMVATLELGGGLPFGRPAFWVGDQLVYRTSPFVGFGTLGIGAVFP